MNKVVIGYFRVIIYLVICYSFDIPSVHEIRLFITDLFYGDYSQEYRDTALVHFSMFLILGILSFYLMQTILYIFLGSALEKRDSGIFNFFRHVFKAVAELREKNNFWTSNARTSNFGNIDDLLSYRDNKMAFMRNADAAELMKKTSHIDTLRTSSNLPQSKKALSYLNNKIALMDNKQALDHIQNK